MSEQRDMGPFADMPPDIVRAITSYGTAPYRQEVYVTVLDVGQYSYDELPVTLDEFVQHLVAVKESAPVEYRDKLQITLKHEEGHYIPTPTRTPPYARRYGGKRCPPGPSFR